MFLESFRCITFRIIRRLIGGGVAVGIGAGGIIAGTVGGAFGALTAATMTASASTTPTLARLVAFALGLTFGRLALVAGGDRFGFINLFGRLIGAASRFDGAGSALGRSRLDGAGEGAGSALGRSRFGNAGRASGEF